MKSFYSVVVVCLVCFNLFAQDKKPEEEGLKVLILGGTTFIGPHLTNELLSHGHKVTHFTRGNEHGFSFPGVEELHGNRYGDLKALEERKWDAVIDTCGYLPRVVGASSKILAQATNHYTFISTISVYDDFNQPSIDEDSSLAKLKCNVRSEEITDETYGPFKAKCEKVIKTYFPDNSLIIRPGLIVGPYDPTDRFTYWVRRLAEGGKVLIPNTPNQKLQLIDVRDLAKWIVKMVEERSVGTYNATGPKEELSLEKLINECSQFARKKADLAWVDERFLIDRHVDDWSKLPFWLPSNSNKLGLFNIDCRKAQDKGLSYRPLSETISDTLNWDDQRIDRTMEVGLTREEEGNLLNQISKD